MILKQTGEPDFTPDAEAFWCQFEQELREKILDNVFCTKCPSPVRMILAEGKMEGEFLVLRGDCALCGQQVSRVVEPPNE